MRKIGFVLLAGALMVSPIACKKKGEEPAPVTEEQPSMEAPVTTAEPPATTGEAPGTTTGETPGTTAGQSGS